MDEHLETLRNAAKRLVEAAGEDELRRMIRAFSAPTPTAQPSPDPVKAVTPTPHLSASSDGVSVVVADGKAVS